VGQDYPRFSMVSRDSCKAFTLADWNWRAYLLIAYKLLIRAGDSKEKAANKIEASAKKQGLPLPEGKVRSQKKSPLIRALDNFASNRKSDKGNLLKKAARDLFEARMKSLLEFQAAASLSKKELAQVYLESLYRLKDHPFFFVKTKS
jgi:hypothetical protein